MTKQIIDIEIVVIGKDRQIPSTQRLVCLESQ